MLNSTIYAVLYGMWCAACIVNILLKNQVKYGLYAFIIGTAVAVTYVMYRVSQIDFITKELKLMARPELESAKKDASK